MPAPRKSKALRKSKSFNVRVTNTVHAAFVSKAKRHPGNTSDVLRELVTAFGEGRVKIVAPKGKEPLYTKP